MAISFDKALGVHEQALRLRGDRSSILADNLANTDTPGYKAKDLNFKGILQGQVQSRDAFMGMQQTHGKHFTTQPGSQYDSLYRVPHQPSIDGNTVEETVENAEFMKNSLAFQASFTFLNSKFKGLMTAIKGE